VKRHAGLLYYAAIRGGANYKKKAFYKIMKKLSLTIILLIIIPISASIAQIASRDLDNLKNDLNHLLGNKYYILKNNKLENEVTVIIFKRYDVTWDNKINYYEYSENIISFLSNNLNKSYKFKINFEISPYIPSPWIDESIKKEKFKLILLIALFGVIFLFIIAIILRSFTLKSKNKYQNKNSINFNNKYNNQ